MLTKPGPATSARSTMSASMVATIASAISRGGRPSRLPRLIATLHWKSASRPAPAGRISVSAGVMSTSNAAFSDAATRRPSSSPTSPPSTDRPPHSFVSAQYPGGANRIDAPRCPALSVSADRSRQTPVSGCSNGNNFGCRGQQRDRPAHRRAGGRPWGHGGDHQPGQGPGAGGGGGDRRRHDGDRAGSGRAGDDRGGAGGDHRGGPPG